MPVMTQNNRESKPCRTLQIRAKIIWSAHWHGLAVLNKMSLVQCQGSTEPLRFRGLPPQGPRPAGGLPPLYAPKYYRIYQYAGGSPLPSLSRQGRRPQPPGYLRGPSNSVQCRQQALLQDPTGAEGGRSIVTGCMMTAEEVRQQSSWWSRTQSVPYVVQTCRGADMWVGTSVDAARHFASRLVTAAQGQQPSAVNM